MTTETVEAPQTLAEYKVERLASPKPPEEKGEVVAEAKEVKDEPEKTDEHDKDADPQAQKKAKLQGRFSELTEQRRAAEQRADREADRAAAAERERDELKAKLEPAKTEEEAPRPKVEDYADAFKYAADLAEWTAKKAVKDDRKERDAADAKAKTDAENEKVQKAWKTRLAETKKETPDWEDVVASSELEVSNPVRDALIESEHGPKIVYLLASEPELVEKLKGLGILAQLREIGRLEARFDKPAAKDEPEPRRRTPPPEPIAPVKGGKAADNPITDSADFKGTFAEYKAARQRMQH